jgi:hypothetical protein
MTWSPRHLHNLLGLVLLAILGGWLAYQQPVLALALGLGSCTGIVCALVLVPGSRADQAADESERSRDLQTAQRSGAIISALVAILVLVCAWVCGFMP